MYSSRYVCPSSLQASEYIFKYIIQSRRLFSLATGGQNEEEFRVCVHELFMSIRFFLSQENKGATPISQTQVGPAWIPDTRLEASLPSRDGGEESHEIPPPP